MKLDIETPIRYADGEQVGMISKVVFDPQSGTVQEIEGSRRARKRRRSFRQPRRFTEGAPHIRGSCARLMARSTTARLRSCGLVAW